MICLLLILAGPAPASEWGPWPSAAGSHPDPYSPIALNRVLRTESNPARLAGLLAIRAYQVLGVGQVSRCQFYPSCSRFTFGAIASQGLFNGSVMGAERILRCHGFAPLGGYPADPARDRLLDPVGAHRPPFAWLGWIGW